MSRFRVRASVALLVVCGLSLFAYTQKLWATLVVLLISAFLVWSALEDGYW